MAKTGGKTTIHDIARALGLNASTVSRALAGNPVVSKKTRDLVSAKAAEMKYRPNHMAAALRRGRSDILGVIVPAIDRAFFGSVIRGIEEQAEANGFHIIVCQSFDSFERERSMVETLRRIQVDGIMLSTAKDARTNVTFYKDLLASGFPIHFFDHLPNGLNAPAVLLNDEKAAYDATVHLISSGYRRIAHLRGPQHFHIYRDRYLGYQRAMKEAGLVVDDHRVVDIVSHFDSGADVFHQLWNLPVKPDAVFSASDYSAAACLNAARELGLSIPGDVAFLGFANEPFTEIISPKLSSVDQQTTEMGRRCAARLIDVLNNKVAVKMADLRVVLEGKVMVRESSVVL